MDANLSGVCTAVSNEGNPKYFLGPRLPEKASFAYFSMKKSESPNMAKTILKNHWIPVFTGMTGEE